MANRKRQKSISRKEFIKRSSAGVVGAGLMANRPLHWFGTTPVTEMRTLGRTGIRLTPLGFGAPRTQQPAILMAALDRGINFIDTGRSYANGQNEIMVGKVIRGMRKNLVIQSKVRINLDGTGLKSGEMVQRIREIMQNSLEESLEALQTDYIDIWLIHGAESEEVIHHPAVMEYFSQAKRQGKIRACGFSSHHNQVELIRADNKIRFYDVAMVSYTHSGTYIHSESNRSSRYDQAAMEAELKSAVEQGMGIVAMKTCSAGLFGKGEETPTFGKAIKWVTDRPWVHTAAVAMPNFTQVDENTAAIFGA